MLSLRRSLARSLLVAVILFGLFGWIPAALAESTGDASKWLVTHDVYVTKVHLKVGKIRTGDAALLQRQVDLAHSQGIVEKLAIVSRYPPNFASSAQAAAGLFGFLDYSGVLVVVSPKGIGIASDSLSPSEDAAIARKARPICLKTSFAACAIFAAQRAAAKAKADKNSAFHDAAVFWLVVLVAIAILILVAVLSLSRRRRASGARLDELRQAANATLSQADGAVQEIEGAGVQLTPDARGEYDRALGLRNRAQAEINTANSGPGLIQANEDAAQAVLALQGVMRKAGIQSALSNPLDLPARRCFYCGRDDRPPYVTRSIDDGKGNTMQVDICSVDAAQLQRGRTPQIATVQYGGSPVPWWAVPNSPWYYGYGGPSWQYWLPFMIGMDIGGWYGGGWGGYGGYGYGDFDGGQAWDNSGGWGQGDQGVGAVPSDAGGADFGGWGGGSDSGIGDSGGADFGGGGWGGDSGGWGGDSGGADFGGGGDGGGWS